MSVRGIDYAWSKPPIAAVKAAGDVFVAQYFSADATKNLTKARADALKAAGIKIVVVWEYASESFKGGKAQGIRDAQAAEAEAKACGVDGIPVYFACDYNAPPGDQGEIDAYLDGTASVLGDDRGRNFYGGYWPASRARAAGKAKRIWGTLAWSGNNWATCGWVPDIMQGAYVSVGGVTCDLDAGNSTDFGQWPRPADVRTWQLWATLGHSSLTAVSHACKMTPAGVLQATSHHFGHLDPVISAYVNGLADGTVQPHHVIPSGARLWVLR